LLDWSLALGAAKPLPVVPEAPLAELELGLDGRERLFFVMVAGSSNVVVNAALQIILN
jgi:hypothetical protein